MVVGFVIGWALAAAQTFPDESCISFVSPTGVVLSWAQMNDLEAELLRKARRGGSQLMGPYRSAQEAAEAKAFNDAEDRRREEAKAAARRQLAEYKCFQRRPG